MVMDVYLIGVLFVFGLMIGSFLNVVVYRTIYGGSIVKGRSMCLSCKKKIGWFHNIPVISYLFLRGRCGNCGVRISWQYPVMEVLTGLLFVWWYMIGRGFFLLASEPFIWVQPMFWLVVGILLLLIFVFDLRFGIIPDGINLVLFFMSAFYRLLLVLQGEMQVVDLGAAVVSGVAVTAMFYGLYIGTKKKGFGFGDVKLAPSIGLLLGWPGVVVGVFGAYVIGAVMALGLLIFGKKKWGQTIPFGPFLVIGMVIALLWGDSIWSWYMSMLL